MELKDTLPKECAVRSQKRNLDPDETGQQTSPSDKGYFVAWLSAARPKTLPAATVPVLTGSAMAWQENGFRLFPAFCCLMFALFAQIAANFINDYADFLGGSDDQNRIGPARACANGWISPRAMLLGTGCTLTVASLFGLMLIPYGGWPLVAVGLTCIVAALLYSTGPLPLSRYAMGDVLVVLFFGIVAVCFTVFVQTGKYHFGPLPVGLAIGLLADNILMINNYRDCEDDRSHCKYTVVVLWGRTFGRVAYLTNGIIAVLLTILWLQSVYGLSPIIFTPVLWLPIHLIAVWRMSCRKGKELNPILGLTARNLLLFGLLFIGTVLFS